ncbi:MAG: GyrI-like domain-containing protein [Brumimicrobium sp.]
MKKVLKFIVILLVIVVGLFFIIPLFMDTKYSVQRSTTVEVDQEIAQNYMKDFSKFDQWSPWANLDPDVSVEIKGDLGEVGSVYSWEGNDDVGTGSMEITSISEDTIKIFLKFIEPFESESPTYYVIKEKDEKTEISWFMKGEMPYPWNIMGLFFSMDDAIGKDFENGLGNLKEKLEKMPKKVDNSDGIEEMELSERTFLGVRDIVKMDQMESFYGKNLSEAFQAVSENDLELNGSPSGLYFSWNPESGETDMAATIPVSNKEVDIEGFETWRLGGKALKIVHMGDYENLADPHNAIEQYMKENSLKSSGPAIEEYITDPGNEPDTNKWVTHIYYLIE